MGKTMDKTMGKSAGKAIGKIARSVSGFVALPIQFKASKSFPEPTTHYIYLRRDEPTLPTAESARSLFVVNVPIATTDLHLKHLFAHQLEAGRVERVDFGDAIHHPTTQSQTQTHPPTATATATQPSKNSKKRKRPTSTDLQSDLDNPSASQQQDLHLPPLWNRPLHPTGSHALVIFIDKPSMEASLRAAKKHTSSSSSSRHRSHNKSSTKPIVWEQDMHPATQTAATIETEPLGLTRYLIHHNSLTHPSHHHHHLLSPVDAYMTLYNHAEQTRSREQAKKRQHPDPDGFITVTKGPRFRPGSSIQVEETTDDSFLHRSTTTDKDKDRDTSKNQNQTKTATKPPHPEENFYRFQMRERRKERQGQLKTRFDVDRRRVEELKRRRRGGGAAAGITDVAAIAVAD